MSEPKYKVGTIVCERVTNILFKISHIQLDTVGHPLYNLVTLEITDKEREGKYEVCSLLGEETLLTFFTILEPETTEINRLQQVLD